MTPPPTWYQPREVKRCHEGKAQQAEVIIPKLREVEVELGRGKTGAEAVKKISVTEQTCYRWKKKYGGLRMDQAKRLKELEKEISWLTRLLADAELDEAILREVAEGKFRARRSGGRRSTTCVECLAVIASANAGHAALPHLRRRGEELDQDMATASQRMAREKDDARYEALAKAFDEMRGERDAATRRVEELSARPNEVTADESPEQKVERLMEVLDELATIVSDEAARQRIRPLVLRLGIWIGLDFEAGKFGKREVRRLRRGVIAFGQDQLPVRMHGGRHVAADHALPAMPSPRTLAVQPVRRLDLDAAAPVRAVGGEHDTQGPAACCRGPTVDPGASGADGTGNIRMDEPNSGMEQSRTRSNVGATRFERATSTSRT